MDVEAIAPGRTAASIQRRGAAWARLRSGTALLLLAAVPLAAQRPTEYDVKAAYLFNFGKFLRQPDVPESQKQTSFDLCVLGRNDFAGALEKLTANEENNGLPERTVQVTSATAARSCAILFVSGSEADRVDRDIADLAGAPVLTVSDIPRFLEHGGMIAFEMQGNHVRFSVSLEPVNKAGLALSSELLKVALTVTGTPKREVQ
jgi:hypothetical protein